VNSLGLTTSPTVTFQQHENANCSQHAEEQRRAQFESMVGGGET